MHLRKSNGAKKTILVCNCQVKIQIDIIMKLITYYLEYLLKTTIRCSQAEDRLYLKTGS